MALNFVDLFPNQQLWSCRKLPTFYGTSSLPLHIRVSRNAKCDFEITTSVNSSSLYIMKTCPCNVYPLEPHVYIVKLGCAGVYPFFLLAHLSRRLTGELIVYPCSGIRPSSFTISKIFSSETAWPIKAKLHVEHP